MKKLYTSILLLCVGFMCQAQEFSSFEAEHYDSEKDYGHYNYFQLNYFRGNHLTTSETLEESMAEGYNAFELRVGTQSSGRQSWQRLHNYPVYGLGVFLGSLGGEQTDQGLGTPSGIYFFYGEPWARFGKFTFMTDLALGLSYDLNPVNPETKEFNTIVGSSVNLYFNINFLLYYQLSERVDLSLGANFFHFSNGRTFTPQRGVNMGGLNLGVKYNFNPIKNYTQYNRPEYQPPIRPEFKKTEKPPLKRFGEIQFTAAIGTVLTEPGEEKTPTGEKDTVNQVRYMTSTLSVEYAYKFARKMKGHVGLDAFYDGSFINTYPDKLPEDVDFIGQTAFGYHIGFQYLIERFSFYYSLGWYFYKESPARGNWYQRAGGRIGITDNLDIHLCLKTRNGGIADWIEWGLAYKLKL